MQVKKKMVEMKNADVRFISLVGRAANRIPFRVIKQDKEHQMLNLNTLGKVMKADKATGPEIVGIVVFKQADKATMEAMEAVLKAEGFKIDAPTDNSDGTVLYAQADMPSDEADTTIVRLSEEMAVVVKGFSPYSQAMSESSDFNEILPASGFFNGVRTASDALMMTIGNILQKSQSGADAAAAIKDATGKFGTYTSTLAEALPASAFKADLGLTTLLAEKKAKPAEGSAAEEAAETAAQEAAEKEKAKKWMDANPGKTMEDYANASKAEAEAALAAKSEADAAAAALAAAKKAEDDKANPMAAVTAMLEGLTASVGKLSETVTGIAAKQENLEKEVANVARKAEDASKQVSSTILASAKDDKEPRKEAKKADEDPRSGCFDSATFARRPR